MNGNVPRPRERERVAAGRVRVLEPKPGMVFDPAVQLLGDAEISELLPRERPDIVQHPAVLVDYRFTEFPAGIYATLAVRVHHTEPRQQML